MTVPPHVVAASLAALGLHDATLPVAHLIADSLLDQDVRLEDGTHRHLVFANPDITVHLSVVITSGRRQLRLATTPQDVDDVTLLQPGNNVQIHVHNTDTDLPDIQPGLTSLVLRHGPHRTPVRTAWITI